MTCMKKKTLVCMTKKQQVMKMNMKVLLLCKKMYYVLFETGRQFQKAGYFLSATGCFCNPKLLSNIRDANRTLTLYYNARKTIIMNKGDLKCYVLYGIIQMELQTFCPCTMCRKNTRWTMTSLRGQVLWSTKWTVLAEYLILWQKGYSSTMLRAILHMSWLTQ